MASPARRPGRPKLDLPPEEIERRAALRRQQLAAAQARRRSKLVTQLDEASQARQAALDEVAELRAQLEAWRQRAEAAEAERAGLRQQVARAEHEARFQAGEVRRWQATNRQLEQALAEARTRAGKGISIRAQSAQARAEVLFEAIAQGENWRTGAKQARSAWETRQLAERLATITRQARVASTAMARVEAELKDIVTPGEQQVLAFARQALAQITEASAIAKVQGRALAKQREAHDEAVRLAKDQAIRAAFAADSPIDQVVVALQCPWTYGRSHDLDELLSGRAFARTMTLPNGKAQPVDWLMTRIQDAYREALSDMAQQLNVDDPEGAHPAARALRTARETDFEAARRTHAGLLERIQVELVARRIEKAGGG